MPTKDKIVEILAKPYARVILPCGKGSFSAEIIEFPGCIGTGDTPAAAMANLEEIAADWLAAAMLQNQEIYEPVFYDASMARMVIEMPAELHERAEEDAKRIGVGLDLFIVHALLALVRPYQPNP